MDSFGFKRNLVYLFRLFLLGVVVIDDDTLLRVGEDFKASSWECPRGLKNQSHSMGVPMMCNVHPCLVKGDSGGGAQLKVTRVEIFD